jgi:hypothetical protein
MILMNGYKHRATGQTAKVNFTDIGNLSGLTDWNDFIVNGGTPLALKNPLGVATGWTITDHGDSSKTFSRVDGVFSNVDFPDIVVSTRYYSNPNTDGVNYIETLGGLNPSKTYTIKTCTASWHAGTGVTFITVGGVTQNTVVEPNAIAIILTFSNISPDGSGNIVIMVGGQTPNTAYNLCSGFIITEN